MMVMVGVGYEVEEEKRCGNWKLEDRKLTIWGGVNSFGCSGMSFLLRYS